MTYVQTAFFWHAAMITVAFRSVGDQVVAGSFPRVAKLRDMQRELYTKFSYLFPSTMAVLTVGDRLYDRFEDLPFADCVEGVPVEVSFRSTDNPFFFDEADRRPSPSLEEEALWEEAVGNGGTTLDLTAWVVLRRAELAPESFEVISVAPWGEEPASEENGQVLSGSAARLSLESARWALR